MLLKFISVLATVLIYNTGIRLFKESSVLHGMWWLNHKRLCDVSSFLPLFRDAFYQTLAFLVSAAAIMCTKGAARLFGTNSKTRG